MMQVCGDCFRSARLAAGQPEPCDDGNAEVGLRFARMWSTIQRFMIYLQTLFRV